jgi:hypothetical protein
MCIVCGTETCMRDYTLRGMPGRSHYPSGAPGNVAELVLDLVSDRAFVTGSCLPLPMDLLGWLVFVHVY